VPLTSSCCHARRNKKKWNGPTQYEDKTSKALMMLPTDMALVWDEKLKPYVELYAKDDKKFYDVSLPSRLFDSSVLHP
jgi:catalase (peroxidase I)